MATPISRRGGLAPRLPTLSIEDVGLSKSRVATGNPKYYSAFPNKLPPNITPFSPAPPDSHRRQIDGYGTPSMAYAPTEASMPRRQNMQNSKGQMAYVSSKAHDRSHSNIPDRGPLDESMMSIFIADSMGKQLKKTNKTVERQEDVINRMIDTQDRLLSEMSDQRRVNTQIEQQLRHNRANQYTERPRITESREKAYRNLTMLNRLGESMLRNDFGFDFLDGGPAFQTMPEETPQSRARRPVRLGHSESTKSFGNPRLFNNSPFYHGSQDVLGSTFNTPVFQELEMDPYELHRQQMRGSFEPTAAMGSPSIFVEDPRETMRSLQDFIPERVQRLPPLKVKKKKKEKENILMGMLPLMMMSQMQSSSQPKDDQLLQALDAQNKVLASLSKDISKKSNNEFKSEKRSLEEKIKELEKKIKTNPKPEQTYFFVKLASKWKNSRNGSQLEASNMYMDAMRNPFFRQQMMMNQQLMMFLGRNGPGGPHGQMIGGPMAGMNGMMIPGFGGPEEGKKKKKKKMSKGPSKKELELQRENELQRQKQEAIEAEKQRQKEEEEKRLQEEEAMRIEKEKRAVIVKRRWQSFRAYFWNQVSFYIYWKNFMRVINEKRNEAIKFNQENLASLMDLSIRAMNNVTKKALEPIFTEKLSIMFIYSVQKIKPYGLKPASKGSAGNKVQKAVSAVKSILTSLLDGTNTANFDRKLLELLAKMSMDRWYPHQGFHFEAELNRVQFTSFGQLKNQSNNPNRIKMMLICLLIFQVLLPKIIKTPWKHYPAVKTPPSEEFRLQMRIIGSMLYWLFYDWIKLTVAIQPGSQMHLPVNLKTKPLPVKPRLDDQASEMEGSPRNRPGDEGELLDDVFDKENDMAALYVENKALLDPLKSIVEGWGDKILKIVVQVQTEIQKEHMEKMMAERMKRRTEIETLLTNKGWEKYLQMTKKV